MSTHIPNSQSPTLSATVRKVAWRLVPVLLIMYILAFLDRSNLGFAKDAFQADTGLSNAAYALGAGIFFIGYAIFEVPSSILMRRYGARFWLARIMISWGVVSALMMFALNEWLFYFLRVLLGIAEAGFFPGVIFYLATWIPVEYRARINGYFYFGAPLAFIFGGPLSGILLDMHGLLGLTGWQIMFLVTGALTVIIGIITFSYLDNSPKDAKWLSAEERRVLIDALDKEDSAKEEHSPRGILRTLLNPVVLYFSIAYLTVQMAVYGVTFYLPSQIASVVGEEVGLRVGLLTAVPWTLAIVITVISTRIADKTGRRRIIAGILMLMAAVGICLSVIFSQPVLVLAALGIGAAGFIAVQPVFWTLPTSFLTGAAAASGVALINSIGSLGGFLAPNVKALTDGWWGPTAGSITLAAIALFGGILIFLSHRTNPAVATVAERTLSTTVTTKEEHTS